MPLNKLENFIKNTEGRILYVNPSDLDSTDSITNQGNSLTKPFKTIQRALLESARFSYQSGLDNDINDKTTILIYPGEHLIDNRPGFALKPDPTDTTRALSVSPSGAETLATTTFSLSLTSEFDLTVEDNVLYKFNSVNGGIIIPRGTSIVGMDLRKTKVRPKYVPNPTDNSVPESAIFRVTGNCYFWQFSFFDGDQDGLVYTDHQQFDTINQSKPTFSHHKLTCFAYADGINEVKGYNETDLSMYYYKLSYAYQEPTGRAVNYEWPNAEGDFDTVREEYEIVGALGTDPLVISSIIAGDGLTPTSQVTVRTQIPHDLTAGTPIKISGVNVSQYNISTIVQSVISTTEFTYLIVDFPSNLPAKPTNITSARVTIESDTVRGASPYIFNCSMRSVYGMQGMLADGNNATGFRSMVVAQFTGISLQKDDRAFVKYNPETRLYESISYSTVKGATLAAESSSTDPNTVYHLDSGAVYRSGWEQTHVKITNKAQLQIVSVFAIGFNAHLRGDSGADASITNSNSNFGQYALVGDGFRNDAFLRDDQGYISHVVSPEWVSTYKEDLDNITWFQIDIPKTQQTGISSHLYLSGFTRQDVAPLGLTQGYRIGANLNENLYVAIGGTEYSSPVYMPENVTAGIQTANIGINSHQGTKFTSASAPNANFELTVNDIGIVNGETIRVFSDDGDLPENLAPNSVYYAIRVSPTAIKVASTFSNAVNNIPIAIYGGTSLRIESRVSDKSPNSIGHPVQWDANQNNWYVLSENNCDLYDNIVNNDYVKSLIETTPAYFKRYEDRRGIDNKLYKLRYVIPKQADNSRNPVDGFVIQQSGQTGFAKTADINATSIDLNDNNYQRNYGFIATCSENNDSVTVRCELPHNVKVGDIVFTENIKDSNNNTGTENKGYNGYFTVTDVPNSMEYKFNNTDNSGVKRNTGNYVDETSNRTYFLPRFSVNDNKGNFSIYRSKVLSEWVKDESDGVYLLDVVAADYSPPTEFTSQTYNQQITDFYPQLDRDNIRKNPPPSVSFARRDPIGKVETNSLLNSLTRESIDKFSTNWGVGIGVSSITAVSAGVATVQLTGQHNFNGFVDYENLESYTSAYPSAGFAETTKYNVRLLDSLGGWNGATAKVTVGVGSTNITGVEIQSVGSGYTGGAQLFFENFTGTSIGVPTTGLINGINDVIQVTGSGKTDSGYYRVTDVPTRDSLVIGISTLDPTITTDQFVFRVGPSVAIASTDFDTTTGLTTFVTSNAHGLRQGAQFTLVNGNNNQRVGEYYVQTTLTGVTSFTAKTVSDPVFVSGYRILPHAFSDNDQSVSVEEAIGSRYFNLYAGDSVGIKTNITNTATVIPVQHASGIGTANRFKIGEYLEIDEEIVRVSTTGLSGSNNDSLSVLRGQLGTIPKEHTIDSLAKKIKVFAVETRRPSIMRASGHTFEYLGFGPGNYSTGLPQVQNRTLTDTEEYLAQAQNRGGGSVVYTGLNNRGDFYIGNKRISSASGKESSFGIPIPTITGEDPSANSVVFDEVTVKQRINVEGGIQQNILSQFDGPVTFTNDVNFTGKVVSSGSIELAGDIAFTGQFPDGARVNNVRIGVGTQNTEITTEPNIGDLILNAAPGFKVAIATATAYSAEVNFDDTVNFTGFTTFSGNFFHSGAGATFCGGPLHCCDDIVAFYGQTSDVNLKENVTILDSSLEKLMGIRGTEYDWKEGHKSYTGHDIGVIAQDVEKVLPEAVSTKPDGTKGVHYNKLIPLLIEAVKDLSQQVDDIKDK
tara:strand:+ start:4801 stop:10065 length:5265 start_codon:yes stop_codon:yes gene_type:complete